MVQRITFKNGLSHFHLFLADRIYALATASLMVLTAMSSLKSLSSSFIRRTNQITVFSSAAPSISLILAEPSAAWLIVFSVKLIISCLLAPQSCSVFVLSFPDDFFSAFFGSASTFSSYSLAETNL